VMISVKLILAVVLVAAFLTPALPVLPAAAQSYDPAQELPKPTTWEMRLNKLGRGISNVLFGWAEIPVTWDAKLKQGKGLAYMVGTAPVLGTTRAVMRTGTGVYEIVTFPTSSDEVNFGPILEPDYIF
jgi:putative exosortase-associated protein (TIGR04073 family)